MVTKEAPINYLEENMEDYLRFPVEKYKNFSLKLNISEPTGVFAKVKLQELHYSIGSPQMVGAGEQKTEHLLGVADAAYIYYRGYYLDENGNKVASRGMSNFGDC